MLNSKPCLTNSKRSLIFKKPITSDIVKYSEKTFIKAIDIPVPQSLIEDFQFN